ncbi:MAG: protein kinase [Gemmatimonadales bacterium]|nr:protein kinase [Gemmatimonadales bacterium]
MLDILREFKMAVAERFRIEEEIGRGGMAIVYRAQDLKYMRSVAIKVLRPELTACLGAERFLREIQIAAKLSHPNIVPVFDSGQAGGLLYYVMPLVEGESLRARLNRTPRLEVEQAFRITRDVGAALRYAHAHEVIHRDIKPENILLASGPAVVTDFGIARAITAAGGAELTSSGFPLGTLGYMSPEQAAGSRFLDARSDVYSLGCVLYEMLAGAAPGRWLNHQEVATRRINCQSAGERERLNRLPGEIEAILVRALAQEPEQRFQSAEEFLSALGEPTSVLTAPAPSRRRSSWAKWRRRLVPPAAVAAVIAAVALVARSRSTEALDPNVLAIAPFDVHGAGLETWREGLVDMLSAALDGAGPLRTVAPSVGVQRWHGRTDGVSAAEFGRDVGAGLVVYGRLLATGPDSVRASITLFDVVAERSLTELEVRERADRVERLADTVAVRLMEDLSERRPLGAWRLASLGSSSPGAVKAFLQGEQHWRGFNLDSARWYYEHAIALDSAFALAYNRLANAVGWDLRGGGEMIAALLKAGALNHGLARRESLLITADSMWGALQPFRGDSANWRLLRRLIPTLEVASREYPLDPYVWYQLGEARYHFGPWLGVSRQAAADAFRRAVEIDERFTPAYRHLIELGLVLDGPEAARLAADGYLRGADSSYYRDAVRVSRALLASEPPDSAEAARLLGALAPEALYQVWYDLKWWPDSNETAIDVARAWQASSDTLPGQVTLAFALAFRGHLRQADSLFGPRIPLLFSQATAFGVTPADSVENLYALWLAAADRTDLTIPWWVLMLGSMPWWAERGDTVPLRRVVAVWDSLRVQGPDTLRTEAAYWSNVSRGYLELARGDSASALRTLETSPVWPECRLCYRPQLARARLLASSGRIAESAEAYDRLAFPLEVVPLPEMVLATLERARIHERLGNRPEAIRDYLFVESAWARADAELQPFVAEAREALQRLAAEPR